MNLAFPKPKDVKHPRPVVKVYRDGREVCSDTTAGRAEYSRRVREMWERQNHKCGLQITPECKARNGRLSIEYAQFDHERPRKMGSGSRDDRIWLDGKPLSRAVCEYCNCYRGSRPITDFDLDGIVP